jgi:hypothetical protein
MAEVVSSVNYDLNYYGNQLKAQGGWSLERIHSGIVCEDVSNWSASRDPNGGTPGQPNSVDSLDYQSEPFELERLTLLDEYRIKVFFSRPLTLEQASSQEYFHVWPELHIDSLGWRPEAADQVEILFNQVMNQRQLYFFCPDANLIACDGLKVGEDTVLFGLPEEPEAGDALINEILFNPYPGSADFIELFNLSDKIIDLSRLSIGSWNEELNLSSNGVAVSDETRLWIPGQFLLISEDLTAVAEHYQLGKNCQTVEVQKMPSLPNDQGSLAVQTSSLHLLDYFEYDEQMHHPLVKDPEGVSLERLSMQEPASRRDNWHSAAGSYGYATPGYRNSQSISSFFSPDVRLEPKVFSPNMDGYKDVLSIRYQMDAEGAIGRISIWNSEGYQVRHLADNILLGKQGVLTWDGTADNGALAEPGIYIVVFEDFGVDEKRSVTRKTCVLSP